MAHPVLSFFAEKVAAERIEYTPEYVVHWRNLVETAKTIFTNRAYFKCTA